MILVTGGTGFIGRALIRRLVEAEHPVRTLIRPSVQTPRLPRGVPVEAAVTSLDDRRGLRAAMVGVDTVYHLAGSEWYGPSVSLMSVDIHGTYNVVQAAVEAGVKRFFFVSHLGADRASAYPVLKAKAIAEEFIRRSGMRFTILRSATVFGPGDGLTTGIAKILYGVPFVFLMPGDGQTLLQPIWVEDLVTCLTWSLDDEGTMERTIEVGGPEYFTFREVVDLVMQKTGIKRRLRPVPPPYLHALTVVLDSVFPRLPVSVYWLDYLAANRTCSLNAAPRVFGLMPSRMSKRMGYLEGRDWRRGIWSTVMGRAHLSRGEMQ